MDGKKENVLKFTIAYLTERKYKVVIRDSEFSMRDLKYGVPQGSVLGPLLFNMYMVAVPLFCSHTYLTFYSIILYYSKLLCKIS